MLGEPEARAHLRAYPFDRTVSSRLEDHAQRVSFFDGSRLVLDAAVTDAGKIESLAPRVGGIPPTAHRLVHELPLLIGWTVLLLWLLVSHGIRVLDATVLAGFVVSIWMYNEAYVAATVWTSLPLLIWLGWRCGQIGFGPPRERAPERAGRVPLAWIALATGAVAVMLTLTSAGESDVAFASMAGGTLLLDGVLPYGNMPPDVFHGDTYPFLNYVVHAPLALWLPVEDAFSDPTGALFVAAGALVLCAAGIHRIAARLWGRAAGWRLTAAWLAFPATVASASSGSNDLLVAAGLVWALVFLPHAGRATVVLASAAWIKVVPVVLAPMWIARLHGGRRVALVAAVAVSLPLVVWLLALDGWHAIDAMAAGVSFQAERGSLFSVWSLIDSSSAQRLFQAAVAALAAAAAIAVWRDRDRGRDPVRIAGLAGMLLFGVQLAANYWTFAYLPWAVPFALIALSGARSR